MINLAPPKNQNVPTEQRPWNSYKLVPGELAFDWQNNRLVRLASEEPVEVLRESRNRILHPNWEWKVSDVVTGKQYKRIEYRIIGASEILSWGVSKRKILSVEFGWAGNRMSLAQPLSEILEYFQNELGDKYVEFKAPTRHRTRGAGESTRIKEMTSDHHSLQGAGNQHSPAPSSPHRVRFNLNEYVWFRPILPQANEFLAKEAKRIASKYLGTPHYQRALEIFTLTLTPDENGWCKMQGWSFMNTFGPGMILGSHPLFVDMEVELERTTE